MIASIQSASWIVVCACALSTVAQAVPTVSVEPPSVVVDPCDEFELQLWINDEADTISNYDVVFRFDPEVLSLVEAIEGSLYANSGFQTWFVAEEESLGTWEVFDAVFPAGSFVLAPGELARVKFEALNPGSSPIEFLSVVVTDIDRLPIDPLAWEDGTVLVDGATDVESHGPRQATWRLGYPHPNPSHEGTAIELDRGTNLSPSHFQLTIYDARGRIIRQLDPALGGQGCQFVWDGRDARRRNVPSGLYLLRLETSATTQMRKVLVIR